jgi:O-antigen/teichoic acid export membrane protein
LAFWLVKVRDLSWFITALLVSNFFTMILILGAQWHVVLEGQFKANESMSVLKGGFPFFLAGAGTILVQQMDKALVVTMLSTELVGYYAAAFAFASAHASLGGALGITTFSALANLSDHKEQGRYLTRIFRQSMLLYIGAAVGVALLARLLIIPLFGSIFAPAIQPSAILAFSTSIMALGNVLNEGLRGVGKTLPGLFAQLVGAGITAISAYFLIPKWGLMGMAWATVLGWSSQLTILLGAAILFLGLRLSDFWGVRLGEMRLFYSHLKCLPSFLKGT